ncbi:MAG: protein tyrosine phosphatase, partial [Pseudomonadota bacterium]
KSGADRAGMASALYLILHEGRPVSEAREQLSIWYGHFRQGKTGILDALFDAYLADNPNDERPFMEWARTDYDPEAITTAFKSSGIGSFITERLLRRE